MIAEHPRRRTVLAAGAMAALAAALPARASASSSLTDALRLRRSTRAFRADPVPEPLLRAAAWAGQGVNRPETGLRTAPSWHGAADTRLYIAEAGGVRLYDPPSDGLQQVLGEDIRARLSPQPFVATAPVVLIYTSLIDAMPTDAPRERKETFAMVDAAMVAQNVYLFCAAEGLGTCLVGGVDAAAIRAALSLEPGAAVTFVQPVGWPA